MSLMTNILDVPQIPGMADEEYQKLYNRVEIFIRGMRRWIVDVKGYNPERILNDVNCPYWCEAFGILHALEILGYGFMGPESVPTQNGEFNLKYWLNQILLNVAYETGYKRNYFENLKRLKNEK